MFKQLNSTTRLAILALGSAAIAACGDTGAPSNNVSENTPSVEITPSEPATPEVVVPQTVVLETVFKNRVPNADMTGSARFDGAVVSTAAGNFATISDNSAERYETYTPAIENLVPGNYRLTALLRQPIGRAEQSLLRIDPVNNDDAARMDVFLSADGTYGRTNGPVSSITIEEGEDRFSEVAVNFVIDNSSAGRYRIIFYPAVGIENKFVTDAVGSMDIGEINLERIQ